MHLHHGALAGRRRLASLLLAALAPTLRQATGTTGSEVPGPLDAGDEEAGCTASLLQKAIQHNPAPDVNSTRAVAGELRGADGSSPLGASRRASKAKLVIWISAFARSGSSTVLSLATRTDSAVFALFEPCHEGDVLEPHLAAQGCGALLLQLASCDFTGILFLWGWQEAHSQTNGAGHVYNPYSAAEACKAADIVAFKTINWAHRLRAQAFPVLAADPRIHMVNIIRDPRSIYSSMQSTRGAFDELKMGTDGLISMCDSLCENLDVKHPQVYHLLYEDLATQANTITMGMYEFLGLPFGEDARSFVQQKFNGDCADSATDPFGDCRGNSSEGATRYTHLSNNEYAAFMAHETCRNVSKAFGYDTWYYNSAAVRAAALGAHWLPIVASVVSPAVLL
mmetsp:Transcript_10679/g.28300  ORF Transcript_10679/g.28300 Transcript_10679/m.28300 type:complete len:396 (-) Transcript_10679:27-1214(-)